MRRVLVLVVVLLSLYVAFRDVGYKSDVCSLYPPDYIPSNKIERQRIAILRQGHGCHMDAVDQITRGGL